MSLAAQATKLKEFRQSLYGTFHNYADVIMNAIDALSSNTTARSVVELTLNPAFERGYSALFKGIASLGGAQKNRICQPQETESLPAKPAKQIADQAQTEGDSIGTSQDSASPKPSLQQKPIQPDQDGQAAQDAQDAQSAGDSKTRGYAQHNTPAAAPLQARSQAQQPAVSPPHSSVHDSSIKPQLASLKPQPTSGGSLAPLSSETCESAPASVPQLSATNQLRHDKKSKFLFENEIQSLVVPYLPSLQKRSFHLFAVDVTSQPRQFSPTLQDRGFVYQPNTIKGNKPVTIGHQYSVVAYLPEKSGSWSAPWVVPLSNRRVTTSCDKELVGLDQIETLICNQSFDFHEQLSVQVVDCSYSKREYLYQSAQQPNLVTMARIRSDRTFYQKFKAAEEGASKAGHPTWYGKRFSPVARQLAPTRSRMAKVELPVVVVSNIRSRCKLGKIC